MSAAKRRNSLGRGLDALFGEEENDDARAPRVVPLDRLAPNPYQPRRQFDDAEMESLVQSIQSQGILQPILVRPDPDDPERFQIIAGERRWRAAQKAPLHDVPVLVRALSDVEALQVAIIENVQRQDLNPIEEADGYRRLINEFGHTQDDLGRAVGKSRSHIANTLRLLDLPDPVRDMVVDGRLSAGHARALLTQPDPAASAKIVLNRGLNVRQTEALARGDAPSRRKAGRGAPANGNGIPGKDADTLELETQLSNRLGLRVSIDAEPKGSGQVVIRFGTIEQLDDLLARLHG